MDKLLDGGKYFEGARWHDGAWYVSDLYTQHVVRVTSDGTAKDVAFVPNQPSGLGWLPDGSLLVVSMKDQRVLRQSADGVLHEHADLTPHTIGYANDMVVDKLGRAYVGTFGFNLFIGEKPAPGAISRVDPDGTVTVVAVGLRFPNGMAVTEDNRTLIVSESFGARMTAFTITDDGALIDQHVWGQVGTAPPFDSMDTITQTDFGPDGCALDAEGHLWVADFMFQRVVRVAPGGAIVDEVKAPEGLGVYSCALGGVDGRTLLLCTAPNFAEEVCKATNDATLYTHEVAVPRGA